MKMTRREALKTLALGAGGALLPRMAFGHDPKASAPSPTASATPAPIGPFTLPALGYAFDALEPHLDAQTMQIHHDKHHAAYVTNLNKAVAGKADLAKWSVEDLLRKLDQVPAEIRTAVRNHGGGHANHSLLWTSLKHDGTRAPVGELARGIDATFGSFSAFQDKWTAAAMSVFGSGWAWLTLDVKGALAIETLPNQDSPLSAGHTPLAGIDVWEHAYYLKFQNRRAEYVAAFSKVMDWNVISGRYRDAKKG
ncbi:MAG: superoxide dismutase [Candidatus Eisenbacteria bacterium]